VALVPVQRDDQPSSAEALTLDALGQPPKPNEKSDDSFDAHTLSMEEQAMRVMKFG